MKYTHYLLSLFTMLSACQSQTGENKIRPNDSKLKYEGRTVITEDSASFCYPGTSVRMSFKGRSLSADLKCNSGYYWVEIDSLKPFKLSTYINDSTKYKDIFPLADNLSDGLHNVQVTLINEGLFDKPVFYGFVLPDDCSLSEVREKTHKIEFIGNSMTCGYGVEAPSKEFGFSDSTENQSLAFSGIVTRYFDAEPMVVARSGIGIYRNFGDSINGSSNPLPTFYDNTFIFDSPKWNFGKFVPEIVCVGLGTNDMSVGEYDKRLFLDAYLRFLYHLKDLYPDSKIILMSGSMLNGCRLQDQKDAIKDAYNKFVMDFPNVYCFDFTPQDGSLGYGADWHPSLMQQEKMAKELIEFIEKIAPDWKKS